MKTKPSSHQLAFDFGRDEPAADHLAERIIAAGLAPNDFILNLDQGLTNPHEVPLPSRLYRFPIEFVEKHRMNDENAADEKRLLLRHPGLADLPFVLEVTRKVGFKPGWEPEDEFGRDRGALPRWWHACDLMSELHWRDLLATRHLTDDGAIFSAVGSAVMRGGEASLTPATARTILAEMGAPEPSDRSWGLLMGDGIWPAFISNQATSGKKIPGGYWAINIRGGDAEAAWLAVHGVEDRWFTRGKAGYFKMGPAGLHRRGLDECPAQFMPSAAKGLIVAVDASRDAFPQTRRRGHRR